MSAGFRIWIPFDVVFEPFEYHHASYDRPEAKEMTEQLVTQSGYRLEEQRRPFKSGMKAYAVVKNPNHVNEKAVRDGFTMEEKRASIHSIAQQFSFLFGDEEIAVSREQLEYILQLTVAERQRRDNIMAEEEDRLRQYLEKVIKAETLFAEEASEVTSA